MEQVEADHRFIKAIVDWAEGGIPSRVAKKIGVSASTINRHYKNPASTKLGLDTLNRLRAAYPNFPGWAARGGPVRSEVAAFGDQPYEEMFGETNLPPIPVVGSAMGVETFDPEKHVELTDVDVSEVLDHIRRPASLARDRHAYALTIVGDSMWPRFRPGRRVVVSPMAPISIGDDVIVQLRGSGVQTATYKDHVTTVLIKELVRRAPTHLELRQFNPDVTFRVSMDQVAEMHKVVGEVF